MVAGGCRVGPDYYPQQPSLPQAWVSPTTAPSSQPASAPAPGADLARWWKEFHDPTLTSLIERAAVSNLDYRTSLAVIRQARATRGVVWSALWPTADALTSYSRRFPGGINSSGNPIAGNLYQVGLDSAWEIDVFGGVQRGVESADAGILTAVENSRNVRVTLVAEVGLNYVSLRGAQERLAIARENLKAQKNTADLTRRKLEHGLVGALDVANADAQVATTASVIPTQEAQIRGFIYNLSVLLGQEPAALVEELTPAAPTPSAPPNVPVGLPSDLLRRRPDIRSAEAQIHSATAQIGVATADLFPKFNMTGSFSFQATDLKNLANWASRNWSFGPSVDWQIFNAGRVFSNIELQKALTEQAVLAYMKTVLTALQDVENAMVAYTYERDHYKALADAVAANTKAVTYATELYADGLTDFLSVLDAQRSLFASQDALSLSNTALSTDLVALYKALGGGWDESPTAPLPTDSGAVAPASRPSSPESQPAAAESQPASAPAAQSQPTTATARAEASR
jgi:NodT family efflux transporter outer membrane factor (OMF) lipoprotein